MACSPTLNWRRVQVQDLQARLPCKPDNAARTVALGTTPTLLQMKGCEADGTLFVVSHLRATNADAAAQVAAQWQTLTLKQFRATSTTPDTWRAPSWAARHVSLRADGSNAQGGPMQARLTWLNVGSDIYHLAVYADTVTEPMVQSFFEDLQIQ